MKNSLIYRSGRNIAVAAWFIAASYVFAQPDINTDADAQFDRANAAYDSGNYSEALNDYESLISKGYAAGELFYNGANAAFRQGKIGKAVLMYRQAWYINPQDADVLTNLQLAMQRTGAIQPKRTVIDFFFQELSHRIWSQVLKTAYWIAVIAIAAALFVNPLRRFAQPVAVAAVIVSLLGLSGWLYWLQWQRGGEAVVIQGKQTALYEPREASTPFFSLPEGSLVSIEDVFDNWVKIRVDSNSGWVRDSVVQRVYPLITAQTEQH